MLSALADFDPALEPALWGLPGPRPPRRLRPHRRRTAAPSRLCALLSGVPLPAKANLLLRWSRKADRHAAYVPLPSPLGAAFPREVVR
ncbi:hypothetical protein ACIRBZ_16380 [Streptomyces sp. NPDC094038]|uniref:hypothetical protein n=1 Tax=Streptomyces sp. NPDC094038 TaxID=3366055 RepID=UPI00382724E3